MDHRAQPEHERKPDPQRDPEQQPAAQGLDLALRRHPGHDNGDQHASKELDRQLPGRLLVLGGRVAHLDEALAEYDVIGRADHERRDGRGEQRQEADLRHRSRLPRSRT
jgi:hypothetical protein